MTKKKDRNKPLILILVILLTLIIGGSYAWFQITKESEKINIIKAGNLSLILDDTTSKGIKLVNAVPMSYQQGLNTEEYTFTLTNNGSISDYTIYLDNVDTYTNDNNESITITDDMRIPDAKIRYILLIDGEEASATKSKLLSDITDRAIDTGTLEANGGSHTYSLRIWIDSQAEKEENGKVFNAMLRVEATQSSKKSTVETLTATFHSNGATIGSSTMSCESLNQAGCNISLPTITRTGGNVIGWSEDQNETTATYLSEADILIKDNIDLYAITSKTYTATFDSSNTTTLETTSRSCNAYNTASSCNIVLPRFNRVGAFSEFWSTVKLPGLNLYDYLDTFSWAWKYFNQIGRKYTLTSNISFYPNFSTFHYDLLSDSNPHYKFRDIDMNRNFDYGNSYFECQSSIPDTAIDDIDSFLNTAYQSVPWLFTPGKVFVFNSDTYSDYSIAYGLTHSNYWPYGGVSYYTIDVQYDQSIGIVDHNAVLHELGHAFDSYYNYRTSNGLLSDQEDIVAFYNEMYADGSTGITKTEWFAAMVTNYYWHILGHDPNESYYGMSQALTDSQREKLNSLMTKYIEIANNDYQV